MDLVKARSLRVGNVSVSQNSFQCPLRRLKVRLRPLPFSFLTFIANQTRSFEPAGMNPYVTSEPTFLQH